MKIIKRTFKHIAITLILIILIAISINFYVRHTGGANLHYSIDTPKNEISDTVLAELKGEEADCIMILGAGIINRNTPSPILKDRLDAGIALYKKGAAAKILLTGDNGRMEHNEIHVMLNYCIESGIPKSDIFCDHAGFSTSESMVRAKEIFDVKKLIVVTQKYHEYRALYIAEKMGMQAIGVSADQHSFSGHSYREIREILARNKDFFKSVFGQNKATGGEKISLSGDGSVSHGE